MTEDIEHQLDRMSRERRKRVRSVIAEANRPDILAEYDAKMKDIDTGVDGARSVWNALSETQRSLVQSLKRNGGYLWRDPSNLARYFHKMENGMTMTYRADTVLNVGRRGLIEWSAGHSPSGSKGVLSERALFILSKADT